MTVQTLSDAPTRSAPRLAWAAALIPAALSGFCFSALIYYHVQFGGDATADGILQGTVVGLYRLLGFVPAVMLALLAFVWSTIWYVTGHVDRPARRVVRIAALAVTLSILLGMQPSPEGATGGGILGEMLASRLESVIGYVLGTLVVSMAVLFALLLATDMMFYRYFEAMARAATAGREEDGVENEAVEDMQALGLESAFASPAAVALAADEDEEDPPQFDLSFDDEDDEEPEPEQDDRSWGAEAEVAPQVSYSGGTWRDRLAARRAEDFHEEEGEAFADEPAVELEAPDADDAALDAIGESDAELRDETSVPMTAQVEDAGVPGEEVAELAELEELVEDEEEVELGEEDPEDLADAEAAEEEEDGDEDEEWEEEEYEDEEDDEGVELSAVGELEDEEGDEEEYEEVELEEDDELEDDDEEEYEEVDLEDDNAEEEDDEEDVDLELEEDDEEEEEEEEEEYEEEEGDEEEGVELAFDEGEDEDEDEDEDVEDVEVEEDEEVEEDDEGVDLEAAIELGEIEMLDADDGEESAPTPAPELSDEEFEVPVEIPTNARRQRIARPPRSGAFEHGMHRLDRREIRREPLVGVQASRRVERDRVGERPAPVDPEAPARRFAQSALEPYSAARRSIASERPSSRRCRALNPRAWMRSVRCSLATPDGVGKP